jgi:hypothetical protein
VGLNGATTKRNCVSAREIRIVIKTDDFPTGTKQLIYKLPFWMTIKNGWKFHFLLKAIPISGINKALGAVLLSRISDDKVSMLFFVK